MSNEVQTIGDRNVRCPEHEVWLSFTDDWGAVNFQEWWESTGKDQWLAYYKSKDETDL